MVREHEEENKADRDYGKKHRGVAAEKSECHATVANEGQIQDMRNNRYRILLRKIPEGENFEA